MNRQPVHTENMLAVTQSQSFQFGFHEKNAIEKKEIKPIREEKNVLTMRQKCGLINNARERQKKDAKKRTKNGHWKVLVGLFLTTNETSTSYDQHNQFSFIRCDYTQVTRNWVNDGANTWCNSENCDKRVSKQQQQQKTTKPTTTKLNWSKMKKKQAWNESHSYARDTLCMLTANAHVTRRRCVAMNAHGKVKMKVKTRTKNHSNHSVRLCVPYTVNTPTGIARKRQKERLHLFGLYEST